MAARCRSNILSYLPNAVQHLCSQAPLQVGHILILNRAVSKCLHQIRKCGRVVCNSCSPHRIIIPYQYIVRPPGSEIPILSQALLTDQLGLGYFDVNGIPGGERVRLCNPCVPDPNIAPPQGLSSSSSTPPIANFRGSHSRSRSSIGNAYEAAMSSNSRHGIAFNAGQLQDPFSSLSSRAYRARSVTLVSALSVR